MTVITSDEFGRKQVHAVEAEQQLLGAILFNNEIIPTVLGIIDLEDFVDPVHTRIFQAILAIIADGRAALPATIAARMNNDAGLDELGGAQYIAKLLRHSVAASSFEQYAQDIADVSERRRMIEEIRGALENLYDPSMPAAEVGTDLEAFLSAKKSRSKAPRPTSLLAAATDALQHAFDAASGNEQPAVPVRIPALGRLVPSMAKGELWLLAGRPSMGKTSIALNFALNAAREGHPVVFGSYEMMAEAMAARAISEQTAEMGRGIEYRRMRGAGLSQQELEHMGAATSRLGDLPLWFLPREYSALEMVPMGIKSCLVNYTGDKLPLIVLDYLQLIKAKGRDKFDQISAVSKGLKALAMDFDCPVLALSQLSRNVEHREDKRPMLSDLRQSGELEEDADGVMFCYRPVYYTERAKPADNGPLDALADWEQQMRDEENQLDVIVAKNRNGMVGTAAMNCNVGLNRLWER